MAIMNSYNKHNMIACIEKIEHNADFHRVIDFLTRCNVNYALLVSPDVIQQWVQQFWSTTKVRMINEVAHIEAKVVGKKILVLEASVRIDLMFNDEDGTDCFNNQVIWDTLRDIGYEGSLTLLSFSKPIFSLQWKYLVHTLLYGLSSKSSSWDQFGTNIASALVGLATNQKFNFSKLIFDGKLRNLKDSKPFLMYPSPKFSRKLTPLTPHMLEVATAKRDEHSLPTEELDIHTSSHSLVSKKAKSPSQIASERTASTNDYTLTDEEFARKVAVEWEEEEERKRLAGLERLQAELEDNEMIAAKGRATSSIKKKQTFYYSSVKKLDDEVKRFNDEFVATGSTEDEQAIKEMNVKAKEPSKKRKGTIRKMKSSKKIKKRKIQKSDDELKEFLKVVNFEDDGAQDVEVMEQHSLISKFSIIQSPEGEYIAVQRANGHIRAFNTLNEVLHILDRQDLHHLHRLVIEYYEHIPPTGLGLILYGDLTTMMETTEESDDEQWRNQTEWEIISWGFYESTGVHILELENGTMIHMLVDQRYPLTREFMQRMLEHKLEVQKETEDALNVITFVMKQKEDLEREEE
ncbi:hypothetical protein Tco_0537506 [Tanacetum coccineum]